MLMARWSRPERSRSHQWSDCSTASLQTDDSFDFHQQFGTTETCDNGFDWARDAGVHKSIARGRTIGFVHYVHTDVAEAGEHRLRCDQGSQDGKGRDRMFSHRFILCWRENQSGDTTTPPWQAADSDGLAWNRPAHWWSASWFGSRSTLRSSATV